MVLPLKVALIGANSGEQLGEEQLVLLNQVAMSVTFDGVREAPLLSINRDFSAPAMIEVERGEQLARDGRFRRGHADRGSEKLGGSLRLGDAGVVEPRPCRRGQFGLGRLVCEPDELVEDRPERPVRQSLPVRQAVGHGDHRIWR